MAQQRFSHSERQAFWEAYERRCAYCDETIRWMDLVVDHIIPESLLDKPRELASVRSEYGLNDLDLRSDLNLVPACARCNRQKWDRLYPPERIMIVLGKARQRAARVAMLRARFQQQPKMDRLLAGVSAAIETGALSKAELEQLFEIDAKHEYHPSRDLTGGSEIKGALANDPDIMRIFGNASCALIEWPKEVAGHWIERSELGAIRATLERERHSFTALLGEPGSGKSALLARLGTELADRSVALLAIKADLIPGSVDTLARLDDYLGVPGPLADCVRQLADTRTVVLLIDQVDALTELMDRNPARLAVLLGLMNRLRGIDDIHIVLSCRDFEFRHDLRLASLKPHPVRLSDLAWEDVRRVLMGIGIEASNWPPEVRRLLSRPQHLSLFVRHLASGSDVPVFRSYHSMLEAVLRERVLRQPWGAAAMRTLEGLAGAMANEEELWLPVARFPENQTELDRLVAADLLAYSPDELRVGFRHQTLFDFLRARAFTARCIQLSAYVLERQNALFVRPTLWSALHYLREADRDAYHREVHALWCREELRNHIRYLLIAFLGQVPDPDPAECAWLLPVLSDPRLRWKVVQAIEGNPGWFTKLQTRLPELMSGDDQAAWHASWLLRQALNFSRKSALGLIEQEWVPYSERDRLTVQTLCALTDWDERAVRVAEVAVRRTPDQDAFGRSVVSLVAKSRPDLAPRILAAELWGALERADREPAQVPPPPPGDAPDSEKITYELIHGDAPSRAVQTIVSDASRWHDLGAVAEAAPRAFVEQVWPWLLHVLRAYRRNESTHSGRYAWDSIFDLPGDERRHLHMDLAAAIEKAICGFARAAPGDFLAFADQHATSEMLVVHRLLARGMKLVAPEHAFRVMQYLIADTRRFALGDHRDEHAETRALISAVVPCVDMNTRLALEQAIIRWEYIRPVHGDAADDRRHRLRWNRQHRIRLLRAFPQGFLSPGGAKLLREEERAIPGTPDRERGIEGGIISSPVSAAQMAKASDSDLLKLFDELHDRTGWHHPRDFLKGGSLETSRAFGDFAKVNHERALELTKRFQPGRHERYAAEALRGTSEAEQPNLGSLIQAVYRLAARGFESEEFRHAAAWALAKISPKNNGLEDRTCALLEGWLRDAKERSTEEVIRSKDADTHRIRSILMEGGIEILPGGNYPILHALFMGGFYRDPTNLDTWLSGFFAISRG